MIRTSAGSALITGSSRGIGKEVALRLAELGYSVAVNYLSAESEARKVVERLRNVGVDAEAFQADLAVESEASQLVPRVEERLGPLTVLVNNAGITRDRLVLQMTEADWAATWCTDLSGPRMVGRSALRSMKPRATGRIVNVSSVVGWSGNAGQANYAAAKSALHGLTRELAVEGASHKIAVNCVVPGYIITDATAHLTPIQRDAWLQRIPMHRPATPEEVADVIVFFASGPAAYITGQCLAVDGGLLAASGAGLGP